jgi:type I restriction enzyme M protein
LAGIPNVLLDLAYGILEEAAERGIPADALQLSCPPPNQGRWLTGAPDPADPRWVFGAPPATRANYAWIQQAISAMPDTALAVILLANDALQTDHPGERPLREALAASGLVKAVIALPGRVFSDDRPPSALVVLEKGACPLARTLFIDLQESGKEDVPDDSGYAGRTLPAEVVAWTLEHYRCLDSSPTDFAVDPERSAIVSAEELEANGWLLTPWTYVHRPTSEAEPSIPSPTQALEAYAQSRQAAQRELNGYLNIGSRR